MSQRNGSHKDPGITEKQNVSLFVIWIIERIFAWFDKIIKTVKNRIIEEKVKNRRVNCGSQKKKKKNILDGL